MHWYSHLVKPHCQQALIPQWDQPLYLPHYHSKSGKPFFQDEQTQSVSIIEAMQTRGKVLPIVLGVAAVDIALATYFLGCLCPVLC